MSVTFRGRFDGKVIVPEEAIGLPINQSIELEWRDPRPTEAASLSARRAARKSLLERPVGGPEIPLEALRRESLYGEDR